MKKLFSCLAAFVRREPVLFAALFLAAAAAIIVRPQPSLYVQAIDFRTLAILFCLMITIKAFQSQNFLDFAAARPLQDPPLALPFADRPRVFFLNVRHQRRGAFDIRSNIALDFQARRLVSDEACRFGNARGKPWFLRHADGKPAKPLPFLLLRIFRAGIFRSNCKNRASRACRFDGYDSFSYKKIGGRAA